MQHGYGLLATSLSHAFLVGFAWQCDLSGASLQGCVAQLESCEFALERDYSLALPTPIFAPKAMWHHVKPCECGTM